MKDNRSAKLVSKKSRFKMIGMIKQDPNLFTEENPKKVKQDETEEK